MKRIRFKHDPASVYLGHGFPWTVRHRQRYDRLVSEGLDRTFDAGSWTLQALEGIGAPVRLEARLLTQHVFLAGTTGCGKTRLLELMALQAARRGDAVAVIDPKGDAALQARLRPGVRVAPHEPGSVPYNPLERFDEPRQIADRVAALLPGDGESAAFRDFAWQVAAKVAAGIRSADMPMDLARLHRFAFTALPELAEAVLRRHAPKRTLDEYRRRRAAGTAAPVPGLDGLLELMDHPREHFLKLGSALAATLSKLTAGRLRKALSAAGFSWDRLMAEGGVALLELPFLRGSDTARAVARLALLDLQHAIGRRPPGGRRLSLFIDEFSDLAMPEFVEVLNKARSMEVSVTVATQTFSDLRASLGSEARAMQILGNAGTIVQFRTHDETDARLFSRLAGREPARTVTRSQSFEPALFGSGSRWVDDFRATFTTHIQIREEDAVPPYLLHRLPNLHAFARVGGRLYKLMVPVVEGGAPCGSF